MRQNQQDNEHRNIIREQILRKGYAHQYDIRRFIPCGREKANQILAQEMLEAEREGKSTITGISANRLPKYVGLTKEEIQAYAEQEKNRTGSAVSDYRCGIVLIPDTKKYYSRYTAGEKQTQQSQSDFFHVMHFLFS